MSTELTPSMRRSILIAALRDKKLWPKGFEWNFRSCETCAIGLAIKLRIADGFNDLCYKLELAGAYHGTVSYTPFGSRDYLGVPENKVTPGMVADRLQVIHEEIEGRGRC